MSGAEEDDPAQTRAVDTWIVAILRRAGVKVRVFQDGTIGLVNVPRKWVAVIDALSAGLHAAARGQELPGLTPSPAGTRRAPK